MTTEPATTVTNLAPYPQTKLRITATYHEVKPGEVTVPGWPENVEIELNELPDGDLHTFITELIDALFQHTPEGTWPAVTYDARGAVADGTVRSEATA